MSGVKIITFVIAVFLSFEVATLQAKPKLLLLAEENYPHATHNIQTGELEGIEVDILKQLMNETGTEYQMTLTPWNRAFRRAQTEKNTCVFPINYTPERADLFQWVRPTQLGGWAIFQRPDSNINIEKIEDVAAYTLVGKMGTQANKQIEAITKKQVLEATTDIAAVQLLYRGRADLLVSGIRDSRIAAQNSNLLPPVIVFNWKPAQFGLACSKGTDVKLIDALREANEKRLATIGK
ncbi:substrate-binding periplasmic protein [Kordiimonas aquimaris]|uniref:substrate-binding periplasmic protein n=1 Tax=Kordiimonas aquimaris TaxID=707591 RepID=UPI0021D31ACA|nr:ABC transporter substrate-binding protein [Kordiimonas aquimaris]